MDILALQVQAAASETTPRWMEMEMQNAVPMYVRGATAWGYGICQTKAKGTVGHPILRLPLY